MSNDERITLDRVNLERLLDTAEAAVMPAIDASPAPAEYRSGAQVMLDALREIAKLMPTGVLVPADAAEESCGCWTCEEERREARFAVDDNWIAYISRRMIVCPDCGYKRCPHGTHHDNACTGSNEPNQPGSRYYFADDFSVGGTQ